MSRKNLAQPQEVPTLACVFSPVRLQSIKAGRQPGSHPEKDGILKDMGPRVQGPNQMNQSIQGLFILAGGTASLWNKGSASELLCTHSSFKGPWIGAAGPGGVKVQSGSSRASGK